tara:strand:- start:773 stop:937 length:165 start_codon:yes stop_codon:yes gene_type:complete
MIFLSTWIMSSFLIAIGTLFFFKKYEPKENIGKLLGAFWLFIGMLIATIIIKNL